MNLPNAITLGRLFLVPVVVWLILTHQMGMALLVFLVAGLSDALDGFIARAFKLRTTLGSYLDPLADKALLVGVYCALVGYIDLWVVILVVFRDIMIIGGILLLAVLRKPIEMNPLMISKINTTVQVVFATAVLFQAVFYWAPHEFITYGGYLVALTTILSGASYVKLWMRKI